MREVITGLAPISELAGIRCYETFPNRCIALQHNRRFYFGPIEQLSQLIHSGSADSFLTDEAAEAKVSELHSQQNADRHLARSKYEPGTETDGMTQTRARWAKEKAAGQWGAK
jgi:hypothetical protein